MIVLFAVVIQNIWHFDLGSLLSAAASAGGSGVSVGLLQERVSWIRERGLLQTFSYYDFTKDSKSIGIPETGDFTAILRWLHPCR